MNVPKSRPFLLIAMLLCLISLARATGTDEAIAAVLAANKARDAAMTAHDLEALDHILAPDFSYTHSNGKQETKETHLKSLREGLRYSKLEASDLRTNVITPDVITLNGSFDQTKGKDGVMKSGRFLFLSVWRKNGDKWQITSMQTALPPIPEVAPVSK